MVFGEGKTAEQIISIVKALQLKDKSVLVTRISKEKANQVLEACPSFAYNEVAKFSFGRTRIRILFEGYIAIVCAGTSDLPVAEEAAVTAEILGCKVRRIYDVGVAGIHRLLNNIEEIQNATVTVVVAGMEGALQALLVDWFPIRSLLYLLALVMEQILTDYQLY